MQEYRSSKRKGKRENMELQRDPKKERSTVKSLLPCPFLQQYT